MLATIAAYHLIWAAYGCWLPNDPRGSSSRELCVDRLAPLGELHHGRKEQQPPSSTIRAFYREADDVLAHNRLLLDHGDVAIVAASFARTIEERGYVCHACAIMPDHVHLVIRRHPDRAEGATDFLQAPSKQALIEARRRPVNHPVWGGRGWKVFLNTRDQIHGRVRYVESNPSEAGLPDQLWEFVVAYDGWLPDWDDA